MKRILFFKIFMGLMIFYSTHCFSQNSKFKESDNNNQIEIGLNLGILNGQINYDGFYIENPMASPTFIKDPIGFLGHLNLCYRRNISKQHYLFAALQNYRTQINEDEGTFVGLLGFSYKSASLGYGYLFNFKNIQSSLFINLPYRYWGGETLIVGYYNNGSAGIREPAITWTNYNSIGIGAGIDIQYFLTKNWGIGMKGYHNYFPFDTKKISNPPVLSNQDFINTYKQVNRLTLLNFKVFYKFGKN